ncbi:uncharacterized protein BX663DRAFT_455516 [Cokeromyces recurvatus]|uniref:uncharacterized protein n=1 Tax=Cokeromyces recurvatus TaxID=90255 RepID=UPI0022204521|nr:uncharacterized protein BX663DRAFT_455516 [Cokeromyces recurvatus]KAI7902039.1 hypothetical protein BX663DRAFT_455516 [Cokeromyces recurvatus]
MDIANRPLPKDFMRKKTKSAPILWIAKNCRATSGREKYIRKLMEYIDVHSYGQCLNNKPFPENKSRLELMSEYKFYLAAENSNCESYATEKLFDTFLMSAVPIVDGPANYDGFLPSKRSVIYMDAYPDPKDLADYIHYLDSNDTAYLEYFSYRQHALDIAAKDRLEPTFISNWSDTAFHNERTSYCSICRGVLPWWNYKTNDINNEYKQEDVFLVDQTCSVPGKWNYIENGPPYTPNWTPRLPDEFTRPTTYINLSMESNITTTTTTTIEDTFDKYNAVLIANASFILFYFVLIVFLIREAKKHTIKQFDNEAV